MPRRIKTGSGPNPCHHDAYNNGFELVKVWNSPASNEITLDIDIPTSTVDEAHILIAMQSSAAIGASSGGLGSVTIGSTYSNEEDSIKNCYSCYDDQFDAFTPPSTYGVGVLGVASGSPGVHASDVEMCADVSYRLVTQMIPAGTKVTINPGGDGSGESQWAVAYFKGGRTVVGGGLADPSPGEDTPDAFSGAWNSSHIISIPGGGGLVIMAGLMDGAGSASTCGLTNFGFHGDGGWGGTGGALVPMIEHTFPRIGIYATTEWPLLPPCIGSLVTYNNHVVWSYAIVPGTGSVEAFDAALYTVSAPQNPLAKAGWLVFEGAEKGPGGCSVGLKVAQHHHSPNS